MSRPTIGERVSELEQVTEQLDRATESLKRSNRETREKLRHLEQLVEAMPDRLAETVAAATVAQTAEFRILLAENETRQADRVRAVARQEPAWTIVVITLFGSILVGLVIDLLLAAANLPHVS
jgi:hypothetical protein